MKRIAVLILLAGLAVALAGEDEDVVDVVEDLGFEAVEPTPDERKALDAVKGKQPGWIVWQSLRDNNWNIYSMRADGTELRRLTDDPLHDENPAWSPDGARIAFDTRRSGAWQVFTMKPDGSEQTLLIDNARRPAWAANGRSVAFERDGKIFLLNLADRSEREIVPGNAGKVVLAPFKADQQPKAVQPTTDLKTIQVSRPALSTDGKQIAFTSDVRFPWEVCLMAVDGDTITVLAWGREAAWLPGTDKVVFTREAGRDGTDIWIRSAAGGRPQVGSSLAMPWGYEYTPAVSPDGRWLVWAAADRHDPFASNYELLLRRLDDPKAQPLRLTFHTAPDHRPSFFIETEAP